MQCYVVPASPATDPGGLCTRNSYDATRNAAAAAGEPTLFRAMSPADALTGLVRQSLWSLACRPARAPDTSSPARSAPRKAHANLTVNSGPWIHTAR